MQMETYLERSFHNNTNKMTLLTSCFCGAGKRSKRQSDLALLLRFFLIPFKWVFIHLHWEIKRWHFFKYSKHSECICVFGGGGVIWHHHQFLLWMHYGRMVWFITIWRLIAITMSMTVMALLVNKDLKVIQQSFYLICLVCVFFPIV